MDFENWLLLDNDYVERIKYIIDVSIIVLKLQHSNREALYEFMKDESKINEVSIFEKETTI